MKLLFSLGETFIFLAFFQELHKCCNMMSPPRDMKLASRDKCLLLCKFFYCFRTKLGEGQKYLRGEQFQGEASASPVEESQISAKDMNFELK